MKPSEVVRAWIDCFNAADLEGLAALYSPGAVNHQVVFDKPLTGRKEIRAMFELEFGRAKMMCIEENLLECGEWAALEWKDPNGLRGCGFFHVENDQITFQRGYFDQLTFFRAQGLPVPDKYLDQVE